MEYIAARVALDSGGWAAGWRGNHEIMIETKTKTKKTQKEKPWLELIRF